MRSILFIISLIISLTVKGQDLSFSNYINTLLYLNPSFAGSSGHRLAYTTRLLERTLPINLPSFNIAYDFLLRVRNTNGNLQDTRSNFGMSGIADNQGLITLASGRQTLIRYYSLSLSYAYRIDLAQNNIIQVGLKAGYLVRQFNNFNLNFPSQFNGTGFNNDAGNEAFSNSLIGSPDFGIGGVYAASKFWVSYAASHLTRPAISFLTTNAGRLAVKHSIAAGYRWQFIRRYRNDKNPSVYIKPSFLVNLQGPSRQIMIGNNFIVLPLSLGAWYRGSNFFTPLDKIGQDALVFTAGIRLPLRVGLLSIHYSYDSPLPRRTAINANAVAHELAITYEFRKVNRYACPNPWR